MKQIGNSLQLSASDLVGFLNCQHLTVLDRAVAKGTLAKPKVWDPLLEILRDRGAAHEQNYIEHLKKQGFEVTRIEGAEVTPEAVAQTLATMKKGAPVIVQGALQHDGWVGRADILRRVEVASGLGAWSYEAVDAKLARETKAGAVLQLCLYSDLLAQAQGSEPEHMFVVVPWSDFEPQKYRFADHAAYYRKVKRGLIKSLANEKADETYPDPKEHCEVCRWRVDCDKRRRADDHLCLVANISKLQINELKQREITTMQGLSEMPLPLQWKPDRGTADTYERAREQARIQVEARKSGEGKFELLELEQGFGLTRLPEPCPGDIFFDLEGDPFVGEHGLEYLFGYHFTEDGEPEYVGEWAFSRANEKRAFENFVDFVMARREKHPGMHIYHYAPYEPAALKRLMGRYATREEEIDRLLRGKVFVDLYQIVRHGIRAGVESYSIKRLEPFFAFKREVPLADVNAALANLQANLELDDSPSANDKVTAVVRAYNKDDCYAAASLRDWLEALRAKLVAEGKAIPRPLPGDDAPNEKITDWLIKINALNEKLTDGVPADPEERNEEQHGRWILANILDWHRREEKVVWWEYFRLSALSLDDLVDERAGLSGLTFVATVGGTAKAPVHRYKFPPQETELRSGDKLCNLGGADFGHVDAISIGDGTVDIKKRKDTAGVHPEAVFTHEFVGSRVMADSLVRIAEHVVENGLGGEGSYQAARDLLLKKGPRIGEQPLRLGGETTVEAAIRLCEHLDGGVLAIQGPPGAGKTFTGAQMICELVRKGKTVGITANSHKVIRKLVDTTIEAADKKGVRLQCCVKADEVEEPQPRLSFAKRSEDLIAALGKAAHVGGATAWLWSRPDAFEIVDVLFVDEAAQMSLANVLAVSQAAKTVVLIGDPQQLDQPMQGSHPEGTDVSALDHVLAGHQTIPPDKGLFLEETWRLHPKICAYTSELFYEGKLRPKAGLERQAVRQQDSLDGAGLYYLPVDHHGNQNSSPEEAHAIATLVKRVLEKKATWLDGEGREYPVTLNDILIIAPYNAQVFEIQQRLPGARVGTVDKFQGQQAPIAIYSTATSSHADAPRGMEFLYSLNRLNVATSRAKCISVMVSSPRIFEADCRTPRQIKLANAFCRYLEMAAVLSV